MKRTSLLIALSLAGCMVQEPPIPKKTSIAAVPPHTHQTYSIPPRTIPAGPQPINAPINPQPLESTLAHHTPKPTQVHHGTKPMPAHPSAEPQPSREPGIVHVTAHEPAPQAPMAQHAKHLDTNEQIFQTFANTMDASLLKLTAKDATRYWGKPSDQGITDGAIWTSWLKPAFHLPPGGALSPHEQHIMQATMQNVQRITLDFRLKDGRMVKWELRTITGHMYRSP